VLQNLVFLLFLDVQDEWNHWEKLGDPILHIDLRDWADAALIAPLSAHTLAKLATGMCDDPLSCCMRAWDFGHGKRPGKPLIMAPAMNSAMWTHPLTKSQLAIIKGFWNEERGKNEIVVIEPMVKVLACGEVGVGALAELNDIIEVTKHCLINHNRADLSFKIMETSPHRTSRNIYDQIAKKNKK